ncbi:MAG: PQQ-binding-like beta-propeller repeat protein, partial [Verrucomicrobiales bacterium]
GGKDGAIVALDKNDGKEIWRCEDLEDRAEYSSLVIAEVDGVRQYVQLFMNTLAGVDAESGDLVWSSEWKDGKTAVIPTPIYRDGQVYMTSGYGAGSRLVKIEGGDAEDVWESKEMANHHGGVVLVDDHVYGFTDAKRGNLLCQEFATGETAWMNRVDKELTKGAVHVADGMLYCLNENGGWVYLVEVNPKEFVERGKFQLPRETELREGTKGKIWAHPVVIGGKLYLRDQDLLFCYDVKK